MVQRRPAAHRRWLAALATLSALSACTTAPFDGGTMTSAGGWHVVERVGQARYSPPGAVTWLSATTGQTIADGSEVTTGSGGRLIVAMSGRHISVGPASHFVLPSLDWDDRLEQRAGWLRYRMANAGAKPFRVYTRSLELEFVVAVLDVRVEQGAVEVTVKEGEVRLATPDGLRRTQLAAGQSALASGPGGTQLAVRRAPEERLEPVDPLIIPAIQPAPTATVAPVTGRPPTAHDPTEPKTTVLPPALEASDRRAPLAPHGPRAIQGPEANRAARPAVQPVRAPAPEPAGHSGKAEASPRLVAPVHQREPAATVRAVDTVRPTGRRGKFERLTEGMLAGVQPLVPTRVRP